jgi:PiT family inorganic phosphate transporter
MWPLSVGAFLGMALGANDGGNLFGTAVATRVIRFRYAALIAGTAVILGAVLQGRHAIETIDNMTLGGVNLALIVTICSALTISLMTWLKLPVSTSQALVGAIVGATMGMSTDAVDLTDTLLTLRKMVICWLITPFGAAIISMVLYYLVGFILNKLPISLLTRDNIIRAGLIIVGAYCSYAFGVNNTANVVGVLKGVVDINATLLAFLGGLSIAIGIWAFGRGLMQTIGAGLIRLDGFTALVVVMAEAVTLHYFGVIGVPVSASQAVVGGVLGVGLLRGAEAIQFAMFRRILFGWFFTPLLSFILAAAAFALFG